VPALSQPFNQRFVANLDLANFHNAHASNYRQRAAMPKYTLTINGRPRSVTAEPDTPLLWVLRDELQLTGTKYGCGVGVCGACTVHQGQTAVRSCQITVSSADGKSFTTIEGLSGDASHPCQSAWIEEDVAQCGFCQPGMIMEAAALLRRNPHPGDNEINAALAHHVCRCGTYQRIRKAVHRAAMQAGKKAQP
jgi:aerobic-type carbon monoxide dehydrogenase small subunit (CoxS/CutS family)